MDAARDTTGGMEEKGGEKTNGFDSTKALLALLNDIYEPRSATGKRMISYLTCLVDKEFRGHSYRSHVSYRITPEFTAHVWPKKSSLKSIRVLHVGNTMLPWVCSCGTVIQDLLLHK